MRTVLEELVTVFTGDARSYIKVVNQVNAITRAATNRINSAFASVQNRAANVFTPLVQGARASLHAVNTAMTQVRARTRAAFLTMANEARRYSGAARNYVRAMFHGVGPFRGTALGRAIYNFRQGLASVMPGGRARGFTTFAGALGARVGAAGALGMRGLRGVGAGIGMARRGAYNAALGFGAGFAGRHPRFTTFAARAGSLVGRGAAAAGALGGAALSAGGRGLAAAGGMAGRGAAAFGGAAAGLVGRGAGALGGLAKGGGALSGAAIASIVGGLRTASGAAASFFATFRQKTRQLGYDLSYLGRRIGLYITTPLLAMATLSVSAFAKFDDAMTTSTAIMQGVGNSTRKTMEDTVFNISKASRFGPTELALGYYHLASAGYEAEAAMKAVGVVEKFATAGAFDLNESGHSAGMTLFAMKRATDFLVDSQAALGLRVEDATKNMENMAHVGDVLTKANMMSNASVEDFAKALVNKGASALRMLNKDLEEGVGVLAAYASQGVKAENAGEKLYIVLRDFQKASIRHADQWAAIGVAVYDTTGKMRKVPDIVEQLEKRFKNMSDEEKRSTLMMLGLQDRSLAATVQLLGTSHAMRQFEAQARNAGGVMEEVAERRLKSFTSQMTMLRNQITIVAIGIGQTLVPYMMKLNNIIKMGIGYWSNLSKPMQKWITLLSLGAAIIGPLLLSLGTLIALAGVVTSALSFIGGVIASVFAPLALIITGVSAAVFGLAYYLIGKDGLIGAFNSAASAAGEFVKKTVGFLEHFSENMQMLWGWMKSNWQIFWKWLGDNWAFVLGDIGRLFLTVFSNIGNNVMVALDTVMQLVSAFGGWLIKMWDKLWAGDFNKSIHKGLLQATDKILGWAIKVLDVLEAALTAAPKKLEAAGEALTNYVGKLVNRAGEGYNADSLRKLFGKILEEQSKKMRGMAEGFTPKTGELNLLPLPKFKTDIPEEIKKAEDPVVAFNKNVANLHDELDEPFDMHFSVSGLDAVRYGSAEMMRLLFQTRSAARNPIAAMPAGVGAAVAPLGMAGPALAGGARSAARTAAILARDNRRSAHNAAVRKAGAHLSDAERKANAIQGSKDAAEAAMASDIFSGTHELIHGAAMPIARPDVRSPAVSGGLGSIEEDIARLVQLTEEGLSVAKEKEEFVLKPAGLGGGL